MSGLGMLELPTILMSRVRVDKQARERDQGVARGRGRPPTLVKVVIVRNSAGQFLPSEQSQERASADGDYLALEIPTLVVASNNSIA
jgi:hypothetical protein